MLFTIFTMNLKIDFKHVLLMRLKDKSRQLVQYIAAAYMSYDPE